MSTSVDNARRHRRPLRVVMLGLAYVLIAYVAIGANPFKGETTGPFDLLASFPGWNTADEYVPVRNGQRSDVLDSFLPGWIEASRQMRQGHLPLWNPLPAGGRAGMLDPTRGMLAPGFLVFALSPDPELGFYLATLLNLFIAGLGMHCLVRRDQSSFAAFFAGVSYMMCGFVAGWLFWPHVATAIWVPWLLWFISLELEQHKGRRVLGIAGCTALLFMGGFPFVVAIGLGCAVSMLAIHALSPWWSGERRPPNAFGSAWGMFGILTGLGLVSVPLLSLYGMLGDADLSYRSGGSSLNLLTHGKLLFQPWAGANAAVETSMYVGMIALLLAVPGFIRVLLKPRTLLGMSAAFFLFVGFILTFGILPDWIGAHLPVLANNPWSRAILLLDVAIILLAAIGLDAVLVNRRWRTGALLLSGIVVLAQGGDLLYQFRKFNGPTEGGHFYNTADLVADLHERLGPFEHVAQDGRLMLISGTAGAVGLSDWFAHAMRSPGLRNMLDAMAADPFSSPTATMIDGSEFHWDRPIMDMSANCYLIGAAGGHYGPQRFATSGGPKFAIGPINSRTVSQDFELSHPVSAAAAVLKVATYQQAGLLGFVDLEVSLAGGEGETLASARVDARTMSDNAEVAFVFDRAVTLSPGAYELRVRYKPGEEVRNLTLWAYDAGDDTFSVDGQAREGVIAFSLLGPADGNLKVLGTEGMISVYENPGCMKGAYWTPDLSDPLASASIEPVTVLAYKPHEFSLEVAADRGGFLVVPMNFMAGWRFVVDEAETEVHTLAGVMPAVWVPKGRHVVTAIYRPPYLTAGVIMTIGAMLLLALAMCGNCRRFLGRRGIR